MTSRQIAPSRADRGAFWKTKIDAWMPSIKALLPATVGPERMARLILVTFQRNPGLMNCTEASVYASIMDAAKLGLEIDCAQQAWLIPYKDQCQLIVGYQGLLQLIYNSGMVSFAKAEVVYSNDLFEYEETQDGTRLRHEPHWMRDPGSAPGDLMAAYAQVTLPNGAKVCQVFGRPTIERHRAASAAWRNGKTDSPWFTAEEEMWKKTAIRAISKLLPKSTTGARTVMAAVELDERGDRGEQHASIDADFSVAEPEKSEPVEKPAVMAEAKATALITAKESTALFTMAEQKHGARARDLIRATLKAHGFVQAAKITRGAYDQIWAEVEAGSHADDLQAQAEGSVHAGSGHDPGDPSQRELV